MKRLFLVPTTVVLIGPPQYVLVQFKFGMVTIENKLHSPWWKTDGITWSLPFDPSNSRINIYLNNQPVSLNTIGFDSSTDFIRLGRDDHTTGRSFDGLLDDVRVWGRPLSSAEVSKLWGNGMGDFGPSARFEIQSPSWGDELNGILRLNQSISGFDQAVP